jgi:uncharacterized membrane protein
MQLIISTFDMAAQAAEVRRSLEILSRDVQSVHLDRLAIVERSADGQIGLSEHNDWRQLLSSTMGAVAGTVTSFLYAFVGLIGPSTGATAAKTASNVAESLVRDMGFPDDALYALGERLADGQAALIVLIDPADEPLVRAELERLGGMITEHLIPPEIAARLREV